MSNPTLPARKAMEMAGMDLGRFNEAVAAGLYPSPPPTTQGKKRAFGRQDFVRLWLWAEMGKMGFAPRARGKHVEDLISAMDSQGNPVAKVQRGGCSLMCDLQPAYRLFDEAVRQ